VCQNVTSAMSYLKLGVTGTINRRQEKKLERRKKKNRGGGGKDRDTGCLMYEVAITTKKPRSPLNMGSNQKNKEREVQFFRKEEVRSCRPRPEPIKK